jgi:hypothetical protein
LNPPIISGIAPRRVYPLKEAPECRPYLPKAFTISVNLRSSAVPPLGFSGLTEDVRDNVTANIGEPKIPSGITISEFLVIESE